MIQTQGERDGQEERKRRSQSAVEKMCRVRVEVRKDTRKGGFFYEKIGKYQHGLVTLLCPSTPPITSSHHITGVRY